VMDYAKTNRLLFLEALRWLHGEESFSGEISETEDKRIVHTKAEDQLWFYTAILGVPSLVLGAGLMLTRRRRRKRKAPAPAKMPAAKKKDADPLERKKKAAATEPGPEPESSPGPSDDDDEEDEK
ncbi:MAG TPA: LPXTG cell wall anchor domain-containing protein, partial [Polyangiaceae bacterium]|nr:LPXTG cell wall anchor domain-containing protein [Polyangiaceae bacterium]